MGAGHGSLALQVGVLLYNMPKGVHALCSLKAARSQRLILRNESAKKQQPQHHRASSTAGLLLILHIVQSAFATTLWLSAAVLRRRWPG
jgi:hypothetical protein